MNTRVRRNVSSPSRGSTGRLSYSHYHLRALDMVNWSDAAELVPLASGLLRFKACDATAGQGATNLAQVTAAAQHCALTATAYRNMRPTDSIAGTAPSSRGVRCGSSTLVSRRARRFLAIPSQRFLSIVHLPFMRVARTQAKEGGPSSRCRGTRSVPEAAPQSAPSRPAISGLWPQTQEPAVWTQAGRIQSAPTSGRKEQVCGVQAA